MVGLINKKDIQDIADAIRAKLGIEDIFKPSEMGDLIRSIRVIPENSYQLKEVTVPTPLATFEASAMPMPKLKVSVDAVQDLHGYDHPWVGGAGKNKLPLTVTDGTRSGVTISKTDDGKVKLNGTATELIDFRFEVFFLAVGTYTLSQGSATGVTLFVSNNGSYYQNTTFTVNESDTSCAAFIRVPNGTVCNNLIIEPMIRLATETDPTFEPYSNICPISGWDEANVSVVGKNKFNPSSALVGTYNDSTNVWSIPAVTTVVKALNATFAENPQYTFSGTATQTEANKNVRLQIVYTDDTTIDMWGTNATTPKAFSVTSASGKSISKILVTFGNSGGGVDIDHLQIEEGSTATTYEPYNSNTYTVEFTDGTNPLTVYGGTLDVTSGELVVDRASVDLGTLNWTSLLDNPNWKCFSTSDILKANGNNNFICSQYPFGEIYRTETDCIICGNVNSKTIYIRDNRYTDVASFKTAMSGVQLVYELATPITYQLTPTQVNSLLGQNNLWADTGDILEVEYFKAL